MIYQWIPSKEPATLGMFKDIVDVNYRATDDLETMYRALHITQVSPNITGHYYCKVSGDRSEALVAKKLVVYGKCTFTKTFNDENPVKIPETCQFLYQVGQFLM